jgi:hypothetical protein
MRDLGSRFGTLIGIATKKRDPDLVDAAFARQPMSAALRYWKERAAAAPNHQEAILAYPRLCALWRATGSGTILEKP